MTRRDRAPIDHLGTLPNRLGTGTGWIALCAAAALWIALTVAQAHSLVSTGMAWVVFGLCYATALVGLSRFHLRAVVNPVTRYLGQISYSLYLMHPIVIALLVPLFRRIQATVPQQDLAYAACAALTLLVALPLAHLGFRLVETPGIRAGHRVLAWLGARVPHRQTA